MRSLVGALLLFATTAPGAAQVADLRIEANGRVHTERGVVSGSAAYAVAVLGALGATVVGRADGARVTLFGDTLVFWDGSPFFRHNDRVHQLAFAARSSGGELRIPEQFFIEWLPTQQPRHVEFRGGVLRARAGAAPGVAPVAPANGARVVVIDPGHGGADPGKIAATGLREKDLTLLIGQRLATILHERGYEVHMTRTSDVLVPLDARPQLANGWKAGRPAALFLSIHANSADSRAAAGFETFFLAEARTEDERRVAEIENAAVRFENGAAAPSADIDHIINGLRNDFYQRASHDLAAVVQDRLQHFHPSRNRGVKQAGFRVLIGALMPAVLIEVGFLSNVDEARLLGTAAFQQRLAWGIADAVDRYFAEHGHLFVTDPR
jgi:N-acetylmuramoyl-L-alanine amidase